jgi:hypothetical protein
MRRGSCVPYRLRKLREVVDLPDEFVLYREGHGAEFERQTINPETGPVLVTKEAWRHAMYIWSIFRHPLRHEDSFKDNRRKELESEVGKFVSESARRATKPDHGGAWLTHGEAMAFTRHEDATLHIGEEGYGKEMVITCGQRELYQEPCGDWRIWLPGQRLLTRVETTYEIGGQVDTKHYLRYQAGGFIVEEREVHTTTTTTFEVKEGGEWSVLEVEQNPPATDDFNEFVEVEED